MTCMSKEYETKTKMVHEGRGKGMGGGGNLLEEIFRVRGNE